MNCMLKVDKRVKFGIKIVLLDTPSISCALQLPLVDFSGCILECDTGGSVIGQGVCMLGI